MAQPQYLHDELVIDDLPTLRALADPLRQRISLLCADRPRTVKELAAVIGVPQTRLYYHVKILEKHGLIHVIDRRLVSGIEERTYSATARSTTVSPELAKTDLANSGALDALFGMVVAELKVALESATQIGDPEGTVPAISMTVFHMSPDDVVGFVERVAALMTDYGPENAGPGKTEYHGIFGAWQVGGADAS